jgi:transposase
MDVEGVCAELSRLLDEGRTEPALELVAELLKRLREGNLRLGVEVSKLLKRHTGRRGEGVSPDQLDLFLKALGDEQESGDEDATGEADAESGEAGAESSESIDDDKRKKPRRRKLPEDLPRTPRVIDVPEEQRACPKHGDKSCIGYAESEVLHFEPARFWVEVIRRETLACRECAGQVSVAPAANEIVEGGMAGPGVVADLLIGKFRDHLPLNRQIADFLSKLSSPSRVILETSAEVFHVADLAVQYEHEVRVVPATLARSLGVGARGVKTDERAPRC